MESLLDFARPCRSSATLPEERGPTETVPGRNAETDRVPEGISEGFHPEQSGRGAPRGREPMAGRGVHPLPEISHWKQIRQRVETLEDSSDDDQLRYNDK